VRIVYGVQSTGRGHLARFAALKPLFDADGHELLVIVSGRQDPPQFFFDALCSSMYERMPGFEMADDGAGGISKRRTASAFLTDMPDLLKSLYQGHKLIADFDPDFIVSDFDPITGSPMVAPSIFKIGVGNWAMARRSGVDQLTGYRLEKFNTSLAIKLCSSGVDIILSCHFYPYDNDCLPPVLRPDIWTVEPRNEGHLLVYHSFPGRLEPIVQYARARPDQRILLYGYPSRPDRMPENMDFRANAAHFLHDLSTCDAYVGTAGFQAICEAFYLRKRIVVQPIEGHYEQMWNAARLEELGMGRWLRTDLGRELAFPFNDALHAQLAPWYENGTRICYERIMQAAGRIGAD
jgi:uncharacterized protein (TIGR00661 family)